MMKEVVEGYLCYGSLMGISVHPESKKWVSVSDDIFTGRMKKFADKKVRITVEQLD
jgi:hypothetical protein